MKKAVKIVIVVMLVLLAYWGQQGTTLHEQIAEVRTKLSPFYRESLIAAYKNGFQVHDFDIVYDAETVVIAVVALAECPTCSQDEPPELNMGGFIMWVVENATKYLFKDNNVRGRIKLHFLTHPGLFQAMLYNIQCECANCTPDDWVYYIDWGIDEDGAHELTAWLADAERPLPFDNEEWVDQCWEKADECGGSGQFAMYTMKFYANRTKSIKPYLVQPKEAEQ